MKNKYLLFFLFLSATICFSASCKKHDDPTPPDQLSLLPAATQTGANTFGCLVNGQAFLPANSIPNGMPPYQCNYIYMNGGYYLVVDGSYKSSAYSITDIGLNTTLLAISEGQTLKLENNVVGKASGSYNLISASVITYSTTQVVNGQMHITKFDQTNQIISGTFSFNAINPSYPDTIHVTDGRFDMKYTQ